MTKEKLIAKIERLSIGDFIPLLSYFDKIIEGLGHDDKLEFAFTKTELKSIYSSLVKLRQTHGSFEGIVFYKRPHTNGYSSIGITIPKEYTQRLFLEVDDFVIIKMNSVIPSIPFVGRITKRDPRREESFSVTIPKVYVDFFKIKSGVEYEFEIISVDYRISEEEEIKLRNEVLGLDTSED